MNTSDYEQKILDVLKKDNKFFQREYVFSNLKSLRGYSSLYFDFVIFKDRAMKEIDYIIEVDGEQHFSRIKFFHKTEKDFIQQLGRDRKKNSFCLANNLTLYRIPYCDVSRIQSTLDILNGDFLVTHPSHNDTLREILRANKNFKE